MQISETCDPKLRSWVDSANGGSDFPIQNLPFGVFRRRGTNDAFRGGVAIGEQILDLSAVSKAGIFKGLAQRACEAGAESELNKLMGMGSIANSELRGSISKALRIDSAYIKELERCLLPQSVAEFDTPCDIGEFTDFYTSIRHARAVGALFRPDSPLMPNYQWIPIAYHGRSSTIGVSGQHFFRPSGQIKGVHENQPTLRPSSRLDYEVEVGVFIGTRSQADQRITVNSAEDNIFGLCLLNDWSARDIQAWEYQPLGPFLGKNFATTVAPWIVTMEALGPYRIPFCREPDHPQPLPYLSSEQNKKLGGIDMQLECYISTETMRSSGEEPIILSTSNLGDAYWNVAQMVVHHSINGCILNPGDLLGTGTQSGPRPDQGGSLIELTSGGVEPIKLPNGETRTFLEDGDEIVMRGYCENDRYVRIGFGEVCGRVLPAPKMDLT